MNVRMVLVGAVALAVTQMGHPAWCAEIYWRKDVPAAAREAVASNKPLLVMVEASWCGPCKRMLQQTFPDPVVTARINAGFIPLLIDADQQAALIQKLNINAFPTMLVLDTNQRVVERVTGYQSAAQLNARLAVLQPAQSRVAQRPVEVAQSPRPASPPQPGVRTLSFHDRAWASIRNASTQEVRPDPPRETGTASPPDSISPAPRDTYEAAREFGAER